MSQSKREWIRYFGAPTAYGPDLEPLHSDEVVEVVSDRCGQTMTVGEMIAAAMTFTPPVSYRLAQ